MIGHRLGAVLVLALLAAPAMTAQDSSGGSVELGYRAVERTQGMLGVTLLDVRVVVGGVEIQSDAAVLTRESGRVRLALRSGGTVTLPEDASIRLAGRDGAKPLYDPFLITLLRLR